VRNDLSIALHKQGEFAEAATVMRAVVAESERVLGPDHETTVTGLGNLATSLFRARDYAGAAEALQKAVRRAERTKHPDHELFARNLASTLRRQGHGAEAEATDGAASSAHGPLAAGERVVLRRLVAQPERNGQRGTVRAYDAATLRYAVDVGDRTLALRRESLLPARCARPGCDADGGLVCSKCDAACYCGRACQKAHWREHKRECR
jgi:hypothetical protein